MQPEWSTWQRWMTRLDSLLRSRNRRGVEGVERARWSSGSGGEVMEEDEVVEWSVSEVKEKWKALGGMGMWLAEWRKRREVLNRRLFVEMEV